MILGELLTPPVYLSEFTGCNTDALSEQPDKVGRIGIAYLGANIGNVQLGAYKQLFRVFQPQVYNIIPI